MKYGSDIHGFTIHCLLLWLRVENEKMKNHFFYAFSWDLRAREENCSRKTSQEEEKELFISTNDFAVLCLPSASYFLSFFSAYSLSHSSAFPPHSFITSILVPDKTVSTTTGGCKKKVVRIVLSSRSYSHNNFEIKRQEKNITMNTPRQVWRLHFS